MSAAEIIAEIQKLSDEERLKVAEFFRSKDTESSASAEFRHVADDVFTTNAELFRKLAQ
jgi:hypothetical protein